MSADDRTLHQPPAQPAAREGNSARWRSRVRVVLSWGSMAACAIVSVAYVGRFDTCAAITVFPVWVWFGAGFGPVVLLLRRRGNRWVMLAMLTWLVFLLAFAEEPWSLLRLVTPTPTSAGERLRVVSLNANIGNRDVLEDLARFRPDLVLLQESPSQAEVETIARRLFGDEGTFVYGVDASLIARGAVMPAELPIELRGYLVQARVRLPSGREVAVISTRLTPGVFRLDLWSPDCWREQAENRRNRREQIGRIVSQVQSVPDEIPIIVGGDFNAPQGDAVFRLFRPRLRDAFAVAGRGWGNTITNDFPFLRIDQIWVSEALEVRSVMARKTAHSDHRMVVCDLAL